jgi:hypothetical protein
VFGGPWLALRCGAGTSDARLELYRIATGAMQTLAIDPSFGPPGCGLGCFTPSGVGADWIALRFTGCGGHCFPVSEFQNLQTGAGREDPSNATTTINLGAPALSEKVCRPVKVPFAAHPDNPPSSWGSVTFDGRFAIVSGPGGVFLEQCGAKLHELLTYTTAFTECSQAGCPPPWNSHLIVWESAPGRLSGIFLPSLQRFTIHVPARVDPAAAGVQFVQGDQYTLVLGSRALYLRTPGGVWMTPVPRLRRR